MLMIHSVMFLNMIEKNLLANHIILFDIRILRLKYLMSYGKQLNQGKHGVVLLKIDVRMEGYTGYMLSYLQYTMIKGELLEYIALRHDITDMILQAEETERTQRELIYRMGESVESRSKESGNHVRRVAHYSKILALLYGISEEESEILFVASTMHDMGKIAIPDSILLKPGRLDKDEFSIMKTHSEIGYKLLAGSNLPILKMASTIAYEHHEHFNGNGYPLGIRENDISIYARIVAIVDVFDALISDRVYKKAWNLDKVLDLFENESAKQFDPVLVKLFLENIDKFMEIKKKFEDV